MTEGRYVRAEERLQLVADVVGRKCEMEREVSGTAHMAL